MKLVFGPSNIATVEASLIFRRLSITITHAFLSTEDESEFKPKVRNYEIIRVESVFHAAEKCAIDSYARPDSKEASLAIIITLSDSEDAKPAAAAIYNTESGINYATPRLANTWPAQDGVKQFSSFPSLTFCTTKFSFPETEHKLSRKVCGLDPYIQQRKITIRHIKLKIRKEMKHGALCSCFLDKQAGELLYKQP